MMSGDREGLKGGRDGNAVKWEVIVGNAPHVRMIPIFLRERESIVQLNAHNMKKMTMICRNHTVRWSPESTRGSIIDIEVMYMRLDDGKGEEAQGLPRRRGEFNREALFECSRR